VAALSLANDTTAPLQGPPVMAAMPQPQIMPPSSWARAVRGLTIRPTLPEGDRRLYCILSGGWCRQKPQDLSMRSVRQTALTTVKHAQQPCSRVVRE
jgi:hypothetical protein